MSNFITARYEVLKDQTRSTPAKPGSDRTHNYWQTVYVHHKGEQYPDKIEIWCASPDDYLRPGDYSFNPESIVLSRNGSGLDLRLKLVPQAARS